MILLLRLLVGVPVRVAYGATKGSMVAGYRLGRLAGYRRLVLLGTGVAVGLLVAPVPGRELRGRLHDAWDRWSGTAAVPPPPPEHTEPGTAPRP